MNITFWEFDYYEYDDFIDLRVECGCEDTPFNIRGGCTVSREALHTFDCGPVSILRLNICNLIEAATAEMKKRREIWISTNESREC